MRRFLSQRLNDPDVSLAESFCGMGLMLAAFAVAAGVCSSIVTVPVTP